VSSLIGVFVAYLLGKRLAGPMAGFFSAALLLLTPVYYGHSFMNPKDIPFAVMFLASVYYLIVSFDHLPRLGLRRTLALGVVLGLTLGIRVGAIMLFGYLVVIVLLWFLTKRRESPSYGARDAAHDLRAVVVSCMGVGLTAWIVMLVWWPYGQLSPILNPLRGLRRAANFTDYDAKALYRGQFIRSDSLPWDYLPTWFSITLPEFYAVILGVGVAALIVRKIRHSGSPADFTHSAKIIFLVFATVFPLATAMVMHPILYDGNRHFLFVIPPLAVLAGVTLAWLLSVGLTRPLKMALGGVVAIIALLTAVDMIRLHPYEYIFFNRSFGGLPAALGRYETDYWGVSHKEGVDWLIANYKPDAPPGSIRVANTAADYQTSYYLEENRASAPRFVPVGKRENPDVMLSITRFDVHLLYPGRVLHVVRRMGTPLLYVTELTAAHRDH
jgi:asparagine N-glycosylation enzyme membrane subunit Stt3